MHTRASATKSVVSATRNMLLWIAKRTVVFGMTVRGSPHQTLGSASANFQQKSSRSMKKPMTPGKDGMNRKTPTRAVRRTLKDSGSRAAMEMGMRQVASLACIALTERKGSGVALICEVADRVSYSLILFTSRSCSRQDPQSHNHTQLRRPSSRGNSSVLRTS